MFRAEIYIGFWFLLENQLPEASTDSKVSRISAKKHRKSYSVLTKRSALVTIQEVGVNKASDLSQHPGHKFVPMAKGH